MQVNQDGAKGQITSQLTLQKSNQDRVKGQITSQLTYPTGKLTEIGPMVKSLQAL